MLLCPYVRPKYERVQALSLGDWGGHGRSFILCSGICADFYVWIVVLMKDPTIDY